MGNDVQEACGKEDTSGEARQIRQIALFVLVLALFHYPNNLKSSFSTDWSILSILTNNGTVPIIAVTRNMAKAKMYWRTAASIIFFFWKTELNDLKNSLNYKKKSVRIEADDVNRSDKRRGQRLRGGPLNRVGTMPNVCFCFEKTCLWIERWRGGNDSREVVPRRAITLRYELCSTFSFPRSGLKIGPVFWKFSLKVCRIRYCEEKS